MQLKKIEISNWSKQRHTCTHQYWLPCRHRLSIRTRCNARKFGYYLTGCCSNIPSPHDQPPDVKEVGCFLIRSSGGLLSRWWWIYGFSNRWKYVGQQLPAYLGPPCRVYEKRVDMYFLQTERGREKVEKEKKEQEQTETVVCTQFS